MRRTSIPRLFGWCGPSAIAGFVMTVVFNAVDRMLRRWTRPNITQESHERLSPVITDANPATAVVFEVVKFRVRAARDHLAPRDVFRRSFLASMAVNKILSLHPLTGSFSLQAPARTNGPSSQVVQLNRFRHAAVTRANKSPAPTSCVRGFDNDHQTPESRSDWDVDGLRHGTRLYLLEKAA